MSSIRTVRATRYVTPLREGGSLPAIVEADDDGLYVLKFRGAGQGHKALVAELVAGELGRLLGLRVPEIVFVEVDPVLGRSEPDFEIQALVQASGGLNLALDYLPGSLMYGPGAPAPDPDLASAIVWFDAFVTNVDRTAKNPNILVWHRALWPIDHGAALYVHHTWTDWRQHARGRFQPVRDHVLLRHAKAIREADARLAPLVTEDALRGVLALVPDEWLGDEPWQGDVTAHREAYVEYLRLRLEAPRAFVDEAVGAAG